MGGGAVKLGTSVEKRTRTFAPKVVTGCITCKIRRIKCDEAKPKCLRCVKTGRKCDGYLPADQAKSLGRKKSPGSLVPKLESCMDQLLTLDISGSVQERSSFEFFRTCTISNLSGFHTNLWQQLILQASHHEPAIRHAAIALGSLHQRFASDESLIFHYNENGDSDGFALEQYVKAISLLVQPIQKRAKPTADITLIACVLFVCFETLRGHHGSALAHIESGVGIVAELIAETDDSQDLPTSLQVAKHPYAPLSALKHVFVRLDNQATQLSSDRHRKLLSPALDNEDCGYKAEIPHAFSSIEEARNSLDHVWTVGLRVLQGEKFADEIGGPTSTLKLSLKLVQDFSACQLRQWSQAFENFFRLNPQEFDDASQECIHAVKIHRILTGVFFGMELVAADIDETVWDDYYTEFDAIITHATAMVKISTAPRAKSKPKPVFSLDTGIILPLYFVATKCRHPTIRRASIALLKSTPRQEGVLNSMLTGRVAERLAEIEEQGLGEIGCAEDIPNWARLSGVDVKFDSEYRRAFLRYMRHSCAESKRDAVQEWLEW